MVDLLKFLVKSRNLSLRNMDGKEFVNYDPLKEANKDIWKKTNKKSGRSGQLFSYNPVPQEKRIRNVIDSGVGLV